MDELDDLDEIDVSLGGFVIFRPTMPYTEFWEKLFQRFQNGVNTNNDLKKAIAGYCNTNVKYRQNGLFGYSVPLSHFKLLPGRIGIFANTRYKDKGQYATIVGNIDNQVWIDSAPEFLQRITMRKKTTKDSKVGNPKTAKKVFRPYYKNGLVLANSIAEIKPFLVSDLEPTDDNNDGNPTIIRERKLPYYLFVETGKPVVSLSLDDPVPCIQLPCNIFAEEASIGFNRSGGAMSMGWMYAWGGSFKLRKLVACVEYVQKSPRNLWDELDINTKQCDLDGRLMVNFMGLAKK